ncbi:MAG: hypothetical protein JST53_14380 [Actinobacteria bacterium]|nr:hypothetical protein [Actinomycetota bacterium]
MASTATTPARSKLRLSAATTQDRRPGRRIKGNLRAGANRRGLFLVGWAVGLDSPAREIKIRADGVEVGLAPLNVDRPDVAELLGDVPGALGSGFHVILEPDGLGSGTIAVQVTLEDASTVDLGTVRVDVGLKSKLPGRRRLLGVARDVPALGWTMLSPPAEREKVLVGNDGWLFLRRDTNDVIGQRAGKVKLGRKKRSEWRRVLQRRRDFIGGTRARWRCLVIPDKEFLYSEHLPEGLHGAQRRPVHEFLRVAEQVGAPVAYALPVLEASKGEAELYPKTDSHWNQRGAFLAYQEICRTLREEGAMFSEVAPGDVRWIEASAPGGLGVKLYPAPISRTIRADLSTHRSALVFDNQVQNHGRVMVFEKEAAEDDRTCCVVFGESFVQNMILFLKETFTRLVFVHTSMMVREIVEAEAPNVVLSLPLERFLVQVPDDRGGLGDIAITARAKAGSGDLADRAAPFMRSIPRRDGSDDPSLVGSVPWDLDP